MKWIECYERSPDLFEEVIFFIDDVIHIEYLSKKDGSSPRKWKWFSYIKDHEFVEGVKFWMPMPKPP